MNGLPQGIPATVTISGPGAFQQSLTASQTLTGLAPGSYTIAAARLVSGGFSYAASPASQAQSVPAGSSASATVSYAAVTGALGVAISGLPGGVTASVIVGGPGGFSQQLTASQLLSGLAPGAYSVSAATVLSGSTTYLPTPAIQDAAVNAGATAAGW